MNKVLEEIKKIGIVPVVVLNDVKDAEPLAKALIDGGLPCAEVTFRTEAAAESIKAISSKYPQMLVGAGTVLTIEQVDEAIEAGAKFIVSPGLNPKVVEYCIEKEIPVTPGISNPSDVEKAIELGLEVVKFFPAEASGGLKFLKAISAPYKKMMFMPTGGISEKNIEEYLSFEKIIACGGSWMVKGDLIKTGEFEQITELVRNAVMTMLGFKIKHIGINGESEDEAKALAGMFNNLFGFKTKVGNSSVFAGEGIEITKTKFLGTKGHIAIGTNNIERAMYYLENVCGASFNMDTAKYKEGKLVAIYLQGEFGGFAVHLALN